MPCVCVPRARHLVTFRWLTDYSTNREVYRDLKRLRLDDDDDDDDGVDGGGRRPPPFLTLLSFVVLLFRFLPQSIHP